LYNKKSAEIKGLQQMHNIPTCQDVVRLLVRLVV